MTLLTGKTVRHAKVNGHDLIKYKQISYCKFKPDFRYVFQRNIGKWFFISTLFFLGKNNLLNTINQSGFRPPDI